MALQIAAISCISLSEIKTVIPDIADDFLDTPEAKDFLWNLGMDTKNYPFEVQNVTHRNRFGNIVTCPRAVGNERICREWVSSGHASRAAVDKASGNKLLVDVYLTHRPDEVEAV